MALPTIQPTNEPPLWLREKLNPSPRPANATSATGLLRAGTTARVTLPVSTGSYPAKFQTATALPSALCTVTPGSSAQSTSTARIWNPLARLLGSLAGRKYRSYLPNGAKPWPENKINGNTGYHRAHREM